MLLSDDNLRDLIGELGIPATANYVEDIRSRLEKAASRLGFRFSWTLDDEKALARLATRYAVDPARALAVPPTDEADRHFRELLLRRVEADGIDPQTWQGAAAVGDVARYIVDAPMPRKDQSARLGESELFQQIVHAIRSLQADHPITLPANENRDGYTPATAFAERFVEIVCDLVRADLDQDGTRFENAGWARARVDDLKGHRSIVDGLRFARGLPP